MRHLGIVLDEDVDNTNKGFLKRCDAIATLNNNIHVGNLTIQNCVSNSTKPLNFSFYNSGDAKVNCGIVEIANALAKKSTNENEVKKYYLNRVLTLNQMDYIYLIFMSVIVVLIILVIRYFTGLTERFNYKTTLDLPPKTKNIS